MLETAQGRSEPRWITLVGGQSLVLELAAPAVAPPAVAAAPPAPAAAPPAHDAPPAAQPIAAPVPARSALAAVPAHRATAAARGQLTLETTPWTTVYFGGKALGQTPLIEAVLPAGHHQLKLVNEEKGITRAIEVDVAPGQTTVMRLTL